MTQDRKSAPAAWDLDTLKQNWQAHLETTIRSQTTDMPLKRLQYQTETDPDYRDVFSHWDEWGGDERVAGWRRLLACAERQQSELLSTCVACGECCLNASPTLKRDDLELLQDEKIKWSDLVTLRKGEPAYSPFTKEAFYLSEEQIKIKEKSGTKHCIFFDQPKSQCSVYAERPTQCRAQACWDPRQAMELAQMPNLTRRDLFAQAGVLLEVLEDHDRRCSFDELRAAFEELKQTEGKSVDRVIDILGFEEHYREFIADKLNIPGDILDLVFGRSLASRVRLFGFKVRLSSDGCKVLEPITQDPSSESRELSADPTAG